MTAPVVFTWDGDVMRPLARFKLLCDRQFVVHQEYPLVVQEERSRASHNQLFAAINEAWHNIPEINAGRWPSPLHLRKWATIQAGHRVEKTIVVASKADALRVSAFIGQIDEYAVVLVRDNIVAHYTAKSLSHRELKRREFQEIKDKIFAVLDNLLGVAPGSLIRQVSPSIAAAQPRERQRETAE